MGQLQRKWGTKQAVRLCTGRQWMLACLSPAPPTLPFPTLHWAMAFSSFLGNPILLTLGPLHTGFLPLPCSFPSLHKHNPSLPSSLRWVSGPQGPQTWSDSPLHALTEPQDMFKILTPLQTVSSIRIGLMPSQLVSMYRIQAGTIMHYC